jgi:toxin ParE1/3/4
MAGKPLEIHPSALAEFRSAVAWYLERNTTAAAKFVAEVDRGVELLLKSPERWPAGEHGTRKFVLRRFPFAVVYREKQESIQILAIAHGHRRPEYWRGRL